MFFYYGVNGSGWVFPVNRYARLPQPLFFHTHCPMCGGELPDLTSLEERIRRVIDDGEGAE